MTSHTGFPWYDFIMGLIFGANMFFWGYSAGVRKGLHG